MFNDGPQFNNTTEIGPHIWDGSAMDWIPSVQFGLGGITELEYYRLEKEQKKRQPIIYFEKQARLITTQKNLRDNMRYPVTQFFVCHKKFSEGLKSLIVQDGNRQFVGSDLCDAISDVISRYDQCLIHLPEDILNVFFDYTDLVEEILLVSKRRHIDTANTRDILIKLNEIYSRIYPIMISCDMNNILSITEELSHIEDEITNQGLIPTDEEFDAEISEEIAAMNDKEKAELTRLRALY